MGFGSGYLDILIFAVIAGVLLYRLRSVLGERDDEDPPSRPPIQVMDEAKNIPNQDVLPAAVNAPHWANGLANFEWVATATAYHQLVPLAAIDPQFHPGDFLEKAKKAFIMVLAAYSEGNKNVMDMLLSPVLAEAFMAQFEKRKASGETYHVVLHAVKSALIAGAHMDGTMVELAVDFIAEQSITHKDAQGLFIADHDGRRRTTKDRWVFARDVRGGDIVWRVIRTEEMDD